jgi:hypothetical protein
VFNLGRSIALKGETWRFGPRLLALRASVLAAVPAALLQVAAAAQGPSPPCGNPAEPAYSAPGEPEHSGTWTQTDLGDRWVPPACTGWTGTDFKIIAALAARFRGPAGVDQLLARFGSISSQVGLRYWSATEQRWRELITAATAVDGPDRRAPRADFSPAELRSGKDLYFSQRDNRSSGEIIYRMRAIEVSPSRIVITDENVTGIRLLLATLFPPGAVQTVHILERQSDGGWGYYSLTRTRGNSSFLTGGFASSYVNRAIAFYRHIAGLPGDGAPAAAR